MVRNKKILLTVGASCGGAERVTVLYAKILMNAGFDVILLVYMPTFQSEYPLKCFIPDNMHVEYVTGRFRKLPYRLLKFIKRIKPNIVFSSNSHTAQILIALKLLRLTKAKVIVRENTSPTRKSRLICRLSQWLYPHATVVIAQTSTMKEEMSQYYKLSEHRINVITNPLDTDDIDQKSKEKFLFDNRYTNYLAVGRLAEPKDYPTLIKAFVNVKKKNDLVRLYIVGKCSDEKIKEELDCIIAQNGLSDSVFFEGFQSNPYKYLKWCDVFCLSSSIEGLPNVLLEALYLHKPVVATRCIPFVSQIIKSGENGYTCATRDYSSLSEIMLKAPSLSEKNISYNQGGYGEIIEIFENAH